MELDPNHYTAQLLNVSLEKYADEIRRKKPLRSRLAIPNAQGEMYRRMAQALDAAADEVLKYRVGERQVEKGDG